MGGAAAQLLAEDHGFLVGVNLDGTLPEALSSGWHQPHELHRSVRLSVPWGGD
jgi:hypothetical protein